MAEQTQNSGASYFDKILSGGTTYFSAKSAESVASKNQKAAEAAARGQSANAEALKKFIPLGIGALVVLVILGFVMKRK